MEENWMISFSIYGKMYIMNSETIWAKPKIIFWVCMFGVRGITVKNDSTFLDKSSVKSVAALICINLQWQNTLGLWSERPGCEVIKRLFLRLPDLYKAGVRVWDTNVQQDRLGTLLFRRVLGLSKYNIETRHHVTLKLHWTNQTYYSLAKTWYRLSVCHGWFYS